MDEVLLKSHVPQVIAEMAKSEPLYAVNIIESGLHCKHALTTVASTYFVVSDYLQLDWLRERINAFPVDDRWSVLARATVKGDLDANHPDVNGFGVEKCCHIRSADKKLAYWLQDNGAKVSAAVYHTAIT